MCLGETTASAALATISAIPFPQTIPSRTFKGRGALMPGAQELHIGDRVSIEGRDGMFFVLSLDHEKRCASLLPSDNGPIVDEVSIETLRSLRGTASQ